jgi:hypothetical protein
MRSRYGSHALDDGARPGVGGGAGGTESVDTPSGLAGFAAPESVDTPLAVAGFAGGPTPGGRRTGMPAALQYPLDVSRRTPVAASIFLSDHPSRPRARTCCLFSSLKTLAIPATDHSVHRLVNVSAHYIRLAGFEVSAPGRFWVSPEGDS